MCVHAGVESRLLPGVSSESHLSAERAREAAHYQDRYLQTRLKLYGPHLKNTWASTHECKHMHNKKTTQGSVRICQKDQRLSQPR